MQNGLYVIEKWYRVSIFAFVCDAPARAFLKYIKGHTAYYSCERCIIKGTCNGRVVFNSDTVASPRTNERFQNLEYDIHQTKRSPLIDIGFPCVTSFSLDYMHLVCLGVTKRILTFLKQGPRECRLSHQQLTILSEKMMNLNGKMPREFARQPRSLDYLDKWKATEFRQFLLYTGSPPPVRKSPRKPQGREQSQIQLPPKKRAKTNELSAAVSRPSQIYEDLSSDEEENETESIPRRSPRKHKDSRPKDSSPTQRNSSPTQRRRMTALPPLESDDSERSVDRRSPSTPTASGYPMPTERFQRRVIQLLVEIRDNLRKGDHGRRMEEEQGEFEVPECDQIPEFEEFDNSLDDRELQKKIKTKMRLTGGTSLGDHVKIAIKRCMTNGLMAKMNLKGKKGKYAFGNTNICRIIKDAVIQSHPNATEANIFDEMSRFLKYAPGRIGKGGRGKES
ncbi:uncharacterized protein LOC128184164 isoform X2 [Crassostrea angulata]|nr:uncharacterized protein LOC128184164 isoform X2 [Crassostrea angulata]